MPPYSGKVAGGFIKEIGPRPIDNRVIEYTIRKMFENVVRDIGDELPKVATRKLRNMTENMKKSALGSRATYRANSKLAKMARDATLEAYEANVIGGGTYKGQYRKGANRDSGGLLPALRNQVNYRATGERLDLFPRDFLFNEAKHYQRLNFGGSGSQNKSQGSSGIINFAPFKVVGTYTYTVEPLNAGKAVRMPAGGFTSRGHFYPMAQIKAGDVQKGRIQSWVSATRGTLTFLPGEPHTPIATRGIKGRHFIDAGIAKVYANIGPVYSTLPKEWFLSAKRNMK